ncbi:uncharacterized protein LOC141654946 [Silene latifolia]|uniref:uncharacterized protein LOC141654946 n=1 Tax=Silene latifolia TaxID=37657 RepID=UPI003D77F9D3
MPETPATSYTSVYKDPLHLTTVDQSLIQLIPHVFDGKSFLHWSRNIRIALITKNKLGFINGGYPQPAEDHDNYCDWIRTDYLLRKDAHQITQGTSSVADYYARLRSIWEDMRSLDPLPECSCGVLVKCPCQILKKIVERENIHHVLDFLMGLDKKYEHTRSQILAMEPLPKRSGGDDGVALALLGLHDQCVPSNVWMRDAKKPKVDRSKFFCDHCEKVGHTIDYCWTYKQWLKAHPELAKEIAKEKAKAKMLRSHYSGKSKKLAFVDQRLIANFTSINVMFRILPLKRSCVRDGRPMAYINLEFANNISISSIVCNSGFSFSAATVLDDVALLHARLGHSSLSTLKHVIPGSILNKTNSSLHCDTCLLAKHHKMPFPISQTVTSAVFDLVHIDLWGPYRVKTLTGASYFLTIVDDFSRVTWTMLLKSKVDVCQTLLNFFAYVNTQFHKQIKVIRSDNGTENGTVERKHRHLLETARALRFQSHLPKRFWGDMILAATHLINLMPTVVLGWMTPFEVLFKTSPDYSHLEGNWSCLCYAAQKVGDKFEPRASRCVFLGYPFAQKGYRLYDLDKKKVILSRDVLFQEKLFLFDPKFNFDTTLRDSANPDFPKYYNNNAQHFSEALHSDISETADNGTQNFVQDSSPIMTSNTNTGDTTQDLNIIPNNTNVSNNIPDVSHSAPEPSRKSGRSRQLSSTLRGFD